MWAAREVRVALRLDIPAAVDGLHKLEVAEDPQFGTAPFLTLETGRVYLRLRPLLTGRVEFGDITLERPRIALIQNAEGRLNVASLAPPSESKTAAKPGRPSGGAAGGAAAAVVSRLKINKGIIAYVAHGKDRPRRRIASRISTSAWSAKARSSPSKAGWW